MYQKSAMAQTFSTVSRLPVIEDYERGNKLDHLQSGRFYEMSVRDGRVLQLRYQKENGTKVRAFEQEVTHIIGSGRRARSYLNLSEQGELTQLPVSWYTQEKQWGMSPGYDQPKHYDFSRIIDRGCLGCHNAYPLNAIGKDGFATRSVYNSSLPQGIDCQRCHGPGSLHVELAKKQAEPSAVRDSIVNPANLSSDLQMDVCLQCHLETTSAKLPHALLRFGRSHSSYRPGEKLSEHLINFDHAPTLGKDDKFEINSSGYRLRQAACFLKSGGRMTCTTCHDPHGAESRSKSRRDSCLQCHEPHEEAARDDCAGCHMPSRRAEDAVHVVITDHKIRRSPPVSSLTAPLEEKTERFKGDLAFYLPPLLGAVDKNLYMGLALVTDDADTTKGLALLQKGIAAKGAQAPIEAVVGRAQALAKQGNLLAAVRTYAQAVQKRPDLAAVRAGYAKALENARQLDAARREYQRALSDDPNLPSAQLGLGRLQNDPQAAAELFRKAAQSWTTRADALNNLGNVLVSQQQFSAAREALEKALSIETDFAEAENNLGRVLAAEGHLTEALKHVERALKLDASYVEARFNFARLLHAVGNRAAAVSEYRRVLERGPDFPEAHLGLGVALAEDGETQAAIQQFLKVLSLRPNDIDAKRNLDLAREIESQQHRRSNKQ